MTQHLHDSRWFTFFNLLLIALFVSWVRLAPLNLPGLEKRAHQLAVIEIAEQIYTNSNQSTNLGIDPEIIETITNQKHLWEERGVELSAELKAQRQYRDKDGNSHTFVSGYDSYHWLRLARNVLETGTHCDKGSSKDCRNIHSLAPVGHAQDYFALPHIYSLAGIHKFITLFEKDYPLDASANCLSLLLALLVIIPAFFVGKQLSGVWGGISVATIVSLGPTFLARTLGVDTDIWNAMLLLTMIWFTMNSLRSKKQSHRIGWIFLASVITGLWAQIWSGWILGYLIILSGLVFHLLVGIIRTKGHKLLAGDLLSIFVYLITCGLIVHPGPADIHYLSLPLNIYQHLLSSDQITEAPLNWPDHLETVAEWKKMGVLGLYASMGGLFQFLLALSGGFLLLINQGKGHSLKVLALCLFSYNILLFWYPPSKIIAFVFLATPLVIAFFYHIFWIDKLDRHHISIPGLLVIALFACLWLGYDASRFLLFSWPIMAILLGSSISLCSQWLWRWLQNKKVKPVFLLLPIVLFSTLCLYIIIPAIKLSQTLIPAMHRSYHLTFSELSGKTDKDAIITGLWEYGYWLQYYSDRRTSTDGGTLLNNANYWVNRAYTREDERETVGIIRMLNCSSDASNVPEGKFSAISRLKNAGLTEREAFKLILKLVKLDKSDAIRLIYQQAKLRDHSDHILEATHCTPPESILITSTEQIVKTPAWVGAGLMDLFDPESRIGPTDQYSVIPRWQGCNSSDISIPDLACPVLKNNLQTKHKPDLFVIDLSKPETAQFHPGQQTGLAGKPGLIMIANEETLEKIRPENPDLPDQGVLVDRKTHQVLIAKAVVLRSFYAQLQLLDGRYSQFFEQLIKQTEEHGDSVIAWRVKRWE